MLPAFIVPETVVQEEGASPAVELGSSQGKPLSLTLGVTRIIEQESLDVLIWGSGDGENWGAKPLAVFPQKFYCGTYQLALDLAAHPEVRYLKAQWKINRWGRGEPALLFGFYLFAQAMAKENVSAGAA